MKSYKQFLEEYVQDDFEPLGSFEVKKELNPKVWDDEDTINSEVRNQLLTIANDFYTATELNLEIQDIILTGSLANYNWDIKYSDFDLHIVINFSDSDIDQTMFKKYTDLVKNQWNFKHNIKVVNYDVELYIQDSEEIHTSTGVYSLLNDQWVVKPTYKEVNIDDRVIRMKAESIMSSIDDLESRLIGLNKDSYEEFTNDLNEILNKVKNYRREGLTEHNGEFSIGNLTFKLLRRNGYLGKLIDMKTESYDKQFS